MHPASPNVRYHTEESRKGQLILHQGMGLAPIPIGVEVPIVSQKQQERLAQQLNAEEGQIEAVQTESVTPIPVTTSASSASPSTSMAEDEATTDAHESQTSEDSQPTGETPQKKRGKRKGKWVSVEEISPKPSYWPLALTVSISVLLMGIMIHPIVIGVGALLVIVSIMGWMLERR